MKKESVFLVVLVVIIGFLVGVIYTNSRRDSSGTGQPVASAPATDYQQQIQMLTRVVQQEPENRNAWVRLGHNYFDSGEPMKAIEAYDKALDLNGNDPNVLTDQGVMYRRVGWYEKAIENFRRANQLDPRHLQSLYNLGIVYRYDTNQLEKAVEVWNKYLQIAPNGQGADQVRQLLQEVQ